MSTSAKPNRSNRRGQARPKIRENSSATPEIIPGVRREIPTYDLLGDEQLDLIEQNAARILKEVGVEFRGDADALELWRKAGADVKGERVRFDDGLVQSIIARSGSCLLYTSPSPRD